MSNIAERALLAYKAEQEERKLRDEAEIVALRASAVDAIIRSAESFGLTIDVDEIEPPVCSAEIRSPRNASWWIVIPVDADLGLKFEWSSTREFEVTAAYPDQLYWDLAPGEEAKKPGGGTYACYGLVCPAQIVNLSDLGKAVIRTREARARWRAKWQKKGDSDGLA